MNKRKQQTLMQSLLPLFLIFGISALCQDRSQGSEIVYFSDKKIPLSSDCEITSLASVSCPNAIMHWEYYPADQVSDVAKSRVKQMQTLLFKLKKKKTSCSLGGFSGTCYKLQYTDENGNDLFSLLAYAKVDNRGVLLKCDLKYSWDAVLPDMVSKLLSFHP